MKHRLTNGTLSVVVDDVGAQILSVEREGREYIWQGAPELWDEHAPILFPICGRLPHGRYSYSGESYELGLHGFARRKSFVPTIVRQSEISLCLRADAETMSAYPFDFELTVEYRLIGARLYQRAKIRNVGNETMYAAYGAHPGFALDGMGELSDCYIDFGDECRPKRIGLAENGLQNGKKTPFLLDNDRTLPLSEEKLGKDGLFLASTSGTATLLSNVTDHGVKVDFADFPYVGFWRESGERARYLCIEPWCSLPSFDGCDEMLENKPDMFTLAPDTERTIELSIEFF